MRGELWTAALWTALTLGMVAACDRKPDFDQRYKAQSDRIGASAASMQRDMANQMAGAHEVDKAQSQVKGGRAATAK